MQGKQIAEFDFDYAEPLVCTAIHNGHELDGVIEANMALSEARRLYEEDPYTGIFTEVSTNRIIGRVSRFQSDLNRPPQRSFYELPEQAWGLSVRENPVSDEEREISTAGYQWFYQQVERHIKTLLEKFDRIFIFDLHSYNHQRGGLGAAYDDPQKNPEIILGTNNMPEKYFGLIEKLQGSLARGAYEGRSLDVRINVKFPGGYFSRWLHHRFGDQVCCIALEFKKIFMNEWTGEVNWDKFNNLKEILSESAKLMKEEISKYQPTTPA